MHKGRLEAFSDGVIAIIITIMVLELRPPHGHDLASLRPLLPVFLTYLLSFGYLGIYWNNHHHMLQSVRHVNGAVLWANLHLLFWLSLTPFAMAWMSEPLAPVPVALYGSFLFMSGVAYYILSRCLVKLHGRESEVAQALGSDLKGKLSVALYLLAIVMAWWRPWAAVAIYVLVALIWLVPDRRFERQLPGEVS